MFIIERLLWKLAVFTYHPRWIHGNRFQRWAYNKNGELLSYLTWQWLADIAGAEKIIERHETEAMK